MVLDVDKYAAAALERAAQDVAQAVRGERNKTLNVQPFSVGQLVGAGRLDYREAAGSLVRAAEAAGLPASEAKAVVARALRAGAARPRRKDERRLAPVPAPVAVEQPEDAPLPRFVGTRWPRRDTPEDGERFSYSFEEMAELLAHPLECADKAALPQWALATFRDNRRAGDAFEVAHGLVLDADHSGVGADTLQGVFGAVAFLLHTTWSNQPSAPRWRVLLPLSRPCSAYECKRLVRWAARLLPGLDECPPAQGYFVPAKRPGYQHHVHPGPALDVDATFAALDEERAMPEPGPWRAARLLAAKRLTAAAIFDPGLVLEMDLLPEELPDLRLREIYKWLSTEVAAGRSVNLLDAEIAPGLSAEVINDLVEHVWAGSAADWPRWLEELRSGNQRERALLALHTATLDLAAGRAEPDEAIEAVVRAVEDLPGGNDAVTLADALPADIEALEKIQNGQAPGSLSTGFPSLDPAAPMPGELVVVGARTSVGKTQFLLQVAHHLARSGVPVLFASAEMSIRELNWRLLSFAAVVPLDYFRRPGGLSTRDRERIAAARAELEPLPIYMSTETTPVAIAALARRLQRRAGIKALFVDYLQRLALPAGETRNLQVGEAARLFAALARDTGLVAYLASQVRRPGLDRPTDPPRLCDLRDSGEIEQHAPIVYLLHREPLAGEMTVAIAKMRNGQVGEIQLQFAGGHILDEALADEPAGPGELFADEKRR